MRDFEYKPVIFDTIFPIEIGFAEYIKSDVYQKKNGAKKSKDLMTIW